MFLFIGLFLGIGLEVVLLLGVGFLVDNVEIRIIFDVGMFFGVDFVVVCFCKFCLGIFVLFRDIWL